MKRDNRPHVLLYFSQGTSQTRMKHFCCSEDHCIIHGVNGTVLQPVLRLDARPIIRDTKDWWRMASVAGRKWRSDTLRWMKAYRKLHAIQKKILKAWEWPSGRRSRRYRVNRMSKLNTLQTMLCAGRVTEYKMRKAQQSKRYLARELRKLGFRTYCYGKDNEVIEMRSA